MQTGTDQHVDYVFQVVDVQWATLGAVLAIAIAVVGRWLWRRRRSAR